VIGHRAIDHRTDFSMNRFFDHPMTRSPDPAPLWHADYQGSPARQFVIGNFRQELQVESNARAFLTGGIVEKVHDVSPKSILDPPAFVEVERAHRIHFDLGMFAQDGAQLALEAKRSSPHLRHGESNHAIRHSQTQGWVTGQSLP